MLIKIDGCHATSHRNLHLYGRPYSHPTARPYSAFADNYNGRQAHGNRGEGSPTLARPLSLVGLFTAAKRLRGRGMFQAVVELCFADTDAVLRGRRETSHQMPTRSAERPD